MLVGIGGSAHCLLVQRRRSFQQDLGDGTGVSLTVVAVYDRALGFGDLTMAHELVAANIDNPLSSAVLVRTDRASARLLRISTRCWPCRRLCPSRLCLAVRWERRTELHDALVSLACSLICWRRFKRDGHERVTSSYEQGGPEPVQTCGRKRFTNRCSDCW